MQVLETAAELADLQALLDMSMEAAGPHLKDVISPERRLSASALCHRLAGMRLVVVATVSADGRPLAGPVDGYFLHGHWYFSSSRSSVRMRHLAQRPAVSATHLPDEGLAVTVHGRAELFDVCGDEHPELKRAMLEWYLPKQGAAFAAWLESEQPVGARIAADRMFTFSAPELSAPE